MKKLKTKKKDDLDQSDKREPDQLDLNANVQPKIEYKPPQLISFAMKQIELETEKSLMTLGRAKKLSDLEKGRLILKFIKNEK